MADSDIENLGEPEDVNGIAPKDVGGICQEDVNGGEEETVTTPFKPSDITISSPPMNLGDLLEMIEAGWINFGTNYQRNENLWDDTKQSRLIESVLLGLRLPAFYFEEVTKRQWNIIDGLQRCCAFRNFCFDNTLELKDLEFLGEQFNHKKYGDFSFPTRRDFKMLPITVNLLTKNTPPEVKYILFKRLNTGGIPLNLQEIRTAMFQGKVTDILKEMSICEEFLNATKNKIPTKRQEDRDFISRFIAFYLQDYRDYQPTLERFINKAMEKLSTELDPKTIEKMMSDFKKAMSAALKIFGQYAFRYCREITPKQLPPLNRALFETIAVTLAQLDDDNLNCLIERKELLNQHIICLMSNLKNWKAFSFGTGMKRNVMTRFDIIAISVKDTLENKPAPPSLDENFK